MVKLGVSCADVLLVLLPFRQQCGMLVEHIDWMSRVTPLGASGGVDASLGSIEGCSCHVLVVSVVADTVKNMGVWFL
jgi:hypothetical protein